MPDERQDSIRQGIHAPEESPSGAAAEAERRRRIAGDPTMDAAMGGTSDESTAAEEAQANAARAGAEPGGRGSPREPAGAGIPQEENDLLRETREASVRAQGGGSSDEAEIRRAAREEGAGS